MTNPIHELAQLANRQPGIAVGGGYISVPQIKSVEDVTGRARLPLYWMGLPIVVCGIFVAMRPETFPDLSAAYAATGSFSLVAIGALWLCGPGRKLYGWRINLFHDRSKTLWFRTSEEAARYREMIVQIAPGVPFLHREDSILWWIWF